MPRRREPASPKHLEPETAPGRWRLILSGLAAVVLLAAVIFLVARPEPERAPAATTRRQLREQPVPVSAPTRLNRAPIAAPAPDIASAAPVDSTNLDPSHGDDFMAEAHLPPHPPEYPPGSQPLTEGVDPMMQPRETNPVDAKTGISVSFGPRVAVVHPPDPLVIDLEVTDKSGQRLPISDGVVRFRPDGTTPEAGPWYSTPLVDDGSGRDLARDDLQYSATFAPTAEQKAALFAGGSHVYVEVQFEAPNSLGRRLYATAMQYSRQPSASLNGKYKDAIEGGSLVVQAGVTAKAAGNYRLIASLYGPDGEQALAFASKAAHLEQGDGWIPLLFFGKILHDGGIDGPYELRYLMLSEEIVGVDVIPGQTVDHAYKTKGYAAGDFSADPYAAPAPTFPIVDMNSPSQQDKPPPAFGAQDRSGKAGTSAPFVTRPGEAPAPTGDTNGK